MKFNYLSSSSSDFPWPLVIVWGLIWLAVLYRILTRRDFDTLAKILWVVVVIFVPVFGVALYWLAAPAMPVDYAALHGEKGRSGSDVAGTPWAQDPGFTQEK